MPNFALSTAISNDAKPLLLLNSDEQNLHIYTAKVLDVNTKKPCSTPASMTIDYIANQVPFPSGPPRSNATLRIATEPVIDTQPMPRLVQDVFYIVNMYNAKTEQQKSVNNIDLTRYFEVTSGSKKNGTRDNRKWIRLGDHVRYECDSTLSRLDEKLASVHPAPMASPEADRTVAVGFEHEHLDLGDLPAVVKKSTAASGNFQTSIADFAAQMVKKYEKSGPLTIVGNRVFNRQSSRYCGLIEKIGIQGTIAYDGHGKANLVRERCTAHFFQPITVAEFIGQFCGPAIGRVTDEKTLAWISSVLKGVQVQLSFNGVEPSRNCHILSVGSSAERDAVWLRALGGVPAVHRATMMPSVNTGSKERPVFHPSELCRIVGEDQIFKGQVPSTPNLDQRFDPTESRKDQYQPKGGDPYPKEQSKGFSLTFVNLVEEVDGQSATAVNSDVVESFREQVCERYNSTLEGSANDKTLELTLATFANTLQPLLKPGIKTTVVIITPHAFSSSETDKLRVLCDTQLGVQCHFAPSREVIKRFHPVHTLGMKLITGGIVQTIFARAKIPKGGEEVSSVVRPAAVASQLYGIHIREQKSSDDFLVDIITISGQNSQDVHVVSDVFRAINDIALASRLSCLIKDGVRGSPKSLSIYIRGMKEKNNERVLRLLSSSIDEWFLDDGKVSGDHHSFTLTSVLPGPNILMTDKDDTIFLDQPFAGVARQMDRNDISIYQDSTDAATAKIFNVLPHYSPTRTTYRPLSVMYLKSTTEPNVAEVSVLLRLVRSSTISKSSAVTLSTQKVPTILQLIGEASRRSQLRVRPKTVVELKAEQDKLAADYQLKVEKAKQRIAGDLLQSAAFETVGEREADIAAKLKADTELMEEAKKTSQPVCEVLMKSVRHELKDTLYFL